MRIVIDLKFSQHAGPTAWNDTVALLAPFAAQAKGHTLLVLLHSQYLESIDWLRFALTPHVTAKNIVVFDAPLVTDVWQVRANGTLHNTMLADLRPELVLLPDLPPEYDAEAPCGSLDPAWPTVIGLLPTASASVAATPFAKHTYARAAGILSRSPIHSALLREHLPEARLIELDGLEPAAAASHLWASFEAICVTHKAAKAVPTALEKPRLAYISPLPPERSGIADYSVELLGELERYYDIDLIVGHDGPYDPQLRSRFPVRSVSWFEAHHTDYARLLYHFGNSPAHKHMFKLLERHPGVVVLHDFFMSNALDHLERDHYLHQGFLRALYYSHGFSALHDYLRLTREEAVWKYPCNKAIIDQATGVIVHSTFARELAQHWYGAELASHWKTLPMIRGQSRRDVLEFTKRQARATLGISDDDFLICSFGMMGSTKLNEKLLSAFLNSTLSTAINCRLVFVGEQDPTRYGSEINHTVAASRAAPRITITGFVATDQYALYLKACDVAVQLRTQTRGETSASVLDCLLHGIPTIVNAHGANAELPDDVLLKLHDSFSVEQLSQALQRLHDDAGLRETLGKQAAGYMKEQHAPGPIGLQFHQTVEHFYHASPAAHYTRLRRKLKRLAALSQPSSLALNLTAQAIAANRRTPGPRQLFVDISAVAQSDLKTGIQRVVRSILLALIKTPPAGYRIEPVYGDGGNRCYRYARQFTMTMLGGIDLALEDTPIELQRGDVFLGLDLFTNGTSQNRQRLLDMRRHGVATYFVIFDILPLLRPEFFPAGTEPYFAEYVETVATVSDGLICISRAVADDVCAWLPARQINRVAPLHVGHFHLGADIDGSAPSYGMPANADDILAAVRARPTLLMVGTLEPRKGQAFALDALEVLWQRGVEVNLVLVGKNGWMVDELVERLERHAEKGKHLFWLQGASDEMLLHLYAESSALLAASSGEGFGLPLIEAAQHGLPIIARDLPVFREISGEHAYYFKADTGPAFADELSAWLILHREGKAPKSVGMPWLTWAASAEQLLDVLNGKGWYRELIFPSAPEHRQALSAATPGATEVRWEAPCPVESPR